MAARLPRRHTPLQTALAALTLLISVTSTAATTLGSSSSSSKRALCLASRSAELADLAACGHAGSISYCLSHPAQSRPAGGLGQVLGYGAVVEAADIQRCFVDAGCTRREAAVEAEWALRRCDELGDSPSMADLRRRHHHHQQNHGREAAAATPAPRILDARQTQGGTTATTTAAPPAASAATTATTSSPPQTVCRTIRTISTTTCPVQTTGPESGRQLPCFPTGLAVAECLPGWRCGSDGQGNPTATCDRPDDHVPTAGVVIGLVLAVAAVAGAATICFCCCRERREHRRVRRAAEAAAIARGAYPPAVDEAATAAPGSGDGEGGRKPPVLQSQQQQYDPFADSQAYQPYQQQRQ
ncbi:hypothetical protein RB596_004860 [Gaeumannomyces avenae]